MARILYFDCFAGIAGDMLIGALIDAGLPFDALREALGSLAVDRESIGVERVTRSGITASKFWVRGEEGHPPRLGAVQSDRHRGHDRAHHHDHEHAHRSLSEIEGLIAGSALSPSARERTTALFRRLAEVEAAIHGIPLDEVHLHEVGALDSVVDIAGAVFAMEWFGADRVVASPLNVGSGTVRTSHGELPVPAPATVALLKGVPVRSTGVAGELVTPTGALLITEFADQFGDLPAMRIDRVGYGAGARELPGMPNVLRVLVGEPLADTQPGDRVLVSECEIDDMNPQIFGVLMDRLYAVGALEVFFVPVQMKKGRPGTLVTVVSPPERRDDVAAALFRETTTIGVRYGEMTRACLAREIVTVETAAGPIRFKLARQGNRVVNATPEFDDCVRQAEAHGLPVKQVQAMAIRALGDRGLA